jgi:hypothetical protein
MAGAEKGRLPPCGEGRPSFLGSDQKLEGEPQRQLQLAREVRLAGDLSEARAAERNVRAVEQRRIHGVQGFRAELRFHAFLDDKVLEH